MAMRILSALCLLAAWAEAAPTPPPQPATGPGGAQYAHAAVRATVYGEGGDQFWIFEPARPTPKSAPLVVFNHGWSAMNPAVYDAWIRHIVRRGHVVVYPRYQAGLLTRPGRFLPDALGAVKHAIMELQTGRHVRPELDKFAIVGHSVGGVLSANMGALAKEEGLPVPRAILSVQPGKTMPGGRAGEVRIGLTLEDLSKVPAETLLVCLVGDRDTICGDADARRIFERTTNVAAANKNLAVMLTDKHGSPALVADHLAPLAGARRRAGVNALDYYGTWKLFDGLCDAAFRGKNREYALGDTPQQRFMGKWSDGTPVKQMRVETARKQ